MEKRSKRKDAANSPPLFEDRQEAGQALAQRLLHYRRDRRVVLVALSPGGVVVGREIALSLGAPMVLFHSRKLPIPGNPKVAFGAMTEAGAICLLSDVISRYEIPDRYIQETIILKKKEILRRRRRFRKTSVGFDLRGRRVILVDEGIAGGAILFSALQWLGAEGAGGRIVALPVSPETKIPWIKALSEESVVLQAISSFHSVECCYRCFDPVSDETARAILTTLSGRKLAA